MISFITLFFKFIFEHINNNDKKVLPFWNILSFMKGGYQPLGVFNVEKWDNESEDKVLLIWNGRQSGTEETIMSGPYIPRNRTQ